MDVVVDRRRAALGPVVEVVGVAERRRVGAATDGAAAVAGPQGRPLGAGDGLAERLEPPDLSEPVAQDPADAGVARDLLDVAAGLRSGSRPDRAALLDRMSRTVMVAGQAGGDEVGEAAAHRPGCCPPGRDDVGDVWPRPAGVAEVTEAQDLLAALDERVGPALPDTAAVAQAGRAGQRLEQAHRRARCPCG